MRKEGCKQMLQQPQHTSAYASIRQHTSAYVCEHVLQYGHRTVTGATLTAAGAVMLRAPRQHTLAYVSIRQHTSAHLDRRDIDSGGRCHAASSQHSRSVLYPWPPCIRQHTSAYVRQHTSAYAVMLRAPNTRLLYPRPPCRIRRHTSAYVIIRWLEPLPSSMQEMP